MDQKKLAYINILLFTGLVILVALLWRSWFSAPKRPPEIAAAPVQRPEAVPQAPGPASYDTHGIKPVETVKAQVRDIGQVYEQYPKEDVGNNFIERWGRLKAEEKARVHEGLDGDIARAKEAIRINPDDKMAAHKLRIARTLKKLAAHDFNISPETLKDFSADAGEAAPGEG